MGERSRRTGRWGRRVAPQGERRRTMVLNHSLAAGACHDSTTRRPPGRSARPMLAKAACWSPKNIAPKRLIATSNEPTSNG